MRYRAAWVAIITLTLAALVSAAAPSQAVAQGTTAQMDCPTTTVEQNVAIARRWYDELWNPQNPAVIDELLSPGHIHHWAIGPDTEGVAAFTERVKAIWAALPAQYTVEQVVASGDLVVLRWVGQGVHVGDFGGIAATGNPVTMTGINIFRIECGKIAEVWSEMDGFGLLSQIGAPPGGSATR